MELCRLRGDRYRGGIRIDLPQIEAMVTQGRQPTGLQIMPTLVTIASSVIQRVTRCRILSPTLLHESSDLSDIARDELSLDVYDHCKEYTMTSVTRMRMHSTTPQGTSLTVESLAISSNVVSGGVEVLC